MPAIKLKKVTAESVTERDRQKEGQRNVETVDNQDESGEDDDEAVTPYSCFDVKVLYGKRERTLPVAEQKLIDWLDSNLEKKEGVYLPPLQLYEFYAETCQLQANAVADVPLFNRYLREKFGRSLGWQDASPYKALLKEKKIKEKKAQGETLNIKMRDIIEEIITAAGNPRKGMRFNTLKVGIMGKYPAVRVDLHPKKLKAALERGVMYDKIERVKGMGMCGLYRLPGESTLDEEPKKKKKVETESEQKAEGGSGEEEAANGTADGDTGDEGGASRAGTKRKAEGDEEAGEEPAKKKLKKKKPKHKKMRHEYRSQTEKHCHPQRVVEAFPMAITFQSDPKITTTTRIKAYVARNYHTDVDNERLKKTLDAGIERGLWEKVSSSSFRLLIDTFHPGHSDTINDRVCQAIVACHEPKTASAGLMKKYIVDYHPDLKVESRPHLFKAALERACSKGTLMRLTGIGAAGSFKLVDQFFPSPAILAGDSEDEAASESEAEVEEQEERYVPRATKHRKSPAKPDRLKIDRPQPKKAKPQKPQKAQKAVSREQRGRVDYAEDSSDEEVYYPTTTQKRSGGTPQAKSTSSKKAAPKAKAGTKRAANTATPEPSAKRSTGSKNRREPAKPSRTAEGGGRSREPVKYADDSDGSSDEETGYLPTPSSSRGGTTKPTKPSPPTPKTPKGKANVSSAKKSSKKAGVRQSRRR